MFLPDLVEPPISGLSEAHIQLASAPEFLYNRALPSAPNPVGHSKKVKWIGSWTGTNIPIANLRIPSRALSTKHT